MQQLHSMAGCKLHKLSLKMKKNMMGVEKGNGNKEQHNAQQYEARQLGSSLLAAPKLSAPVMTISEVS